MSLIAPVAAHPVCWQSIWPPPYHSSVDTVTSTNTSKITIFIYIVAAMLCRSIIINTQIRSHTEIMYTVMHLFALWPLQQLLETSNAVPPPQHTWSSTHLPKVIGVQLQMECDVTNYPKANQQKSHHHHAHHALHYTRQIDHHSLCQQANLMLSRSQWPSTSSYARFH